MEKSLCACGYSISTSGEIPNRNEWRCLSETDFDQLQGMVDAEAVSRATTIMYRCLQSDHLWIYWHGFDKDPTLYTPMPVQRAP